MIKVYFDGSCYPNPYGHARGGAAVYLDQGRIIHLSKDYEGRLTSNNVAEYFGLIIALESLLSEGLKDQMIHVYGDSRLVVQAINSQHPSNGICRSISFRAIHLSRLFPNASFSWIPRYKNTEADSLCDLSVKSLPVASSTKTGLNGLKNNEAGGKAMRHLPAIRQKYALDQEYLDRVRSFL